MAKHVKDCSPTIKLLLREVEVHSDTESTHENPPQLRRIKLAWRSCELDEFIALADNAVIAQETVKARRTAAREARAARAEYSTEVIPADEQLPPKKFPRCLVDEEFLQGKLDEATVESLNLSATVVDLNPVLERLRQKFEKGNQMQVS